MALHELKTLEDVIDVKFNSRLGLLAVLFSTSVSLYEYNPSSKGTRAPESLCSTNLPDHGVPFQIEISNESVVTVLLYNSRTGSQAFAARLNSDNLSFDQDPLRLGIVDVSKLFTSVDGDFLFFESSSGRVAVLDKPALATSASIQLSEYCPWLEVSMSQGNVRRSMAEDIYT
jgi:hypothetical protein